MAAHDDIGRVVERCLTTMPELATAELTEGYFYAHLPLCVINAVFSIGVRYEATKRVVQRYCDHFALERIRPDPHGLPPHAHQQPLTVFVTEVARHGVEAFTDDVFANRQRTSTRNGILKTEAAWLFARALIDNGANYLQDIPAVVNSPHLEAAISAIPGQSSGISLSYFFMLAGSDDLVKPDRMIRGFLHDALGRSVSPQEAQVLLRNACGVLRRQYPRLTPRLLDSCIWRRESSRRKGGRRRGGDDDNAKTRQC